MIVVAKVQRFSEQTKDFPKNLCRDKQKKACLMLGMPFLMRGCCCVAIV